MRRKHVAVWSDTADGFYMFAGYGAGAGRLEKEQVAEAPTSMTFGSTAARRRKSELLDYMSIKLLSDRRWASMRSYRCRREKTYPKVLQLPLQEINDPHYCLLHLHSDTEDVSTGLASIGVRDAFRLKRQHLVGI